jgi:hypothetical protein
MLIIFCLRVKGLALKTKSTYPQGYFPTTPGLGVMLMLIFGTIVSMVGWNFLGLQPVGIIFHKDKSSLLWYHFHVYECISAIYLIIV